VQGDESPRPLYLCRDQDLAQTAVKEGNASCKHADCNQDATVLRPGNFVDNSLEIAFFFATCAGLGGLNARICH